MNLFREPANAAPMAWFTGTKDNSGRVPGLTDAARAIHTPMHFIYAEKGPTEPQLLVGQELINTYGDKFLDARSKYATPSLPFIRRLQANANPMLIQRLVPGNLTGETDADRLNNATARVGLFLLIEKQENKKPYKRLKRTPGLRETTDETKELDASWLGDLALALQTNEEVDQTGLPKTIRTDNNGLSVEYRVRDESKESIPVAYKAQWVYRHVERLGGQSKRQVDNKTEYPIMEFEATWFGSQGNNLGFSLYAPTTQGIGGINEKTIRDQLSYLYRIEFYERANPYSTPTVIANNYGENYTTFSFKEGAFDKQNGNSDLFIDTMLLDQYRNLDPVANRAPTYGPFNAIHVYHDMINEIVEQIYEAEIKVNPRLKAIARDVHTQGVKSAAEAAHLINFISGFDHEGVEYEAYEVDWSTTPFTNGEAMFFPSRSNRIFALGGNDGVLSDEQFDKDVRNVFNKMGSSSESYKIEDMAQYPVRCFYDVGYTMETKMSMFRILGIRPDVNLTMSPHDVITKRDRNALAEARSMKSKLAYLKQLSLRAENYPESTIFGTSVMRCVFPTNIGRLMNSDWTRDVPSTIEIQEMRSRYMGSTQTRFTTGLHYDESPNNVVSLLKDLDDLAVFGSLREQMWAEGGVWFQNKRRNVPFCPAVQTAYKDDTSVLNSDINLQIVCEINYICFEVWTELTGTARYTNEQFVARSDALIAEKCRDRFDGRVIVTPRTTLTKQDLDRGWSWTCYVDVELPNMRTVARNTVVTHRIGEVS